MSTSTCLILAVSLGSSERDEHIQRYGDSLSRLKSAYGSVRTRFKQLERNFGKDVQRSLAVDATVFKGRLSVDAVLTEVSGNLPKGSEFGDVRNDDYRASLMRRTREEPFGVVKLTPIDDKTAPRPSMVYPSFSAPWVFFGAEALENLKSKELEWKSAQRTQGAAGEVAVVRLANSKSDTVFEFAVSKQWALVRATSQFANGKSSMHLVNEYAGELTDGAPRLKRSESWIERAGEKDRREWTIIDVERLEPISEADPRIFRLPHYGIPEPEFPTESSNVWKYVIVLIVAIGAILALVLWLRSTARTAA